MSEQGNESALTVEQVAEIVRRMSLAEMAKLVRLAPGLVEAVQRVVTPSPEGDDRPTHEVWLEKLKGVAIRLTSDEDEDKDES